ncbi:MAG: 2,3-dihydroxybiphenyl 1,2-dioxygenase [Actinobacteria bacterium]|nr:MAG: 2,3-dihydroxybiphenyl 1,2-dioxygenase [Actinomycetota bacterium]
MHVQRLGYLVIESTNLDAWRQFGTEILGMALGQRAGADALHLRMDDQPFRIAVIAGAEDRLQYSGWQVANQAALDELTNDLAANGVAVERVDRELAKQRCVGDLVRVTDPGGAALELYCSPILDHEVFVSPAGVSGFVTGALGLGHVVMLTPAFDESLAFYTQRLGFKESDSMMLDGMQLKFLHCNPRHHSLALATGPRSMLAHFMVEARSIDDVGYALDRCEANGLRVKQGIGRHSNDEMISFYAQTPARFDFEFGWGGRLIDDATWAVQEITKSSHWGHRRPPRPTEQIPPAPRGGNGG